jgi:hypothetical protein
MTEGAVPLPNERLARIVLEVDAWVHSTKWRDTIRDSQADLFEGRVTEFDTGDELLAHLEALDADAEGA